MNYSWTTYRQEHTWTLRQKSFCRCGIAGSLLVPAPEVLNPNRLNSCT
jgi:fatty acid desaturase/cytochrome b involved in lipid metabolism